MLRAGNQVFFTNGTEISTLPSNSVWLVREKPNGELYLQSASEFKEMELYGENTRVIQDLCVKHYRNANRNNLGYLFDGVSGTGKTQTIKNVIRKLDLPCIMIDRAYSLVALNSVLSNITCDVAIFFDEFEKIYSEKEASEELLTLFDGFDTPYKKLFMCSFNDTRNLSQYFFNRPGRFVFRFNYSPLSEQEGLAFIKSKCDIADKEKEMMFYLAKIAKLSYDICDKIIELINLYGIDEFINISKFLNLTEEVMCYRSSFKVPGSSFRFTSQDKEVKTDQNNYDRILELYGSAPNFLLKFATCYFNSQGDYFSIEFDEEPEMLEYLCKQHPQLNSFVNNDMSIFDTENEIDINITKSLLAYMQAQQELPLGEDETHLPYLNEVEFLKKHEIELTISKKKYNQHAFGYVTF